MGRIFADLDASNVPTGGVAIILLCMFLRPNESQDKNRNLPLPAKFERMDIMGTMLFIGAMCCLIFALQQGGQTVPWNSSTIVGSFVGFGILFLAFSFVQWTRGETALIPLRVLRQRSILMGNFYLFFIGILTGLVRHIDLTILWRLLMLVSMDSTFHFISKSSKASQQPRAVFE